MFIIKPSFPSVDVAIRSLCRETGMTLTDQLCYNSRSLMLYSRFWGWLPWVISIPVGYVPVEDGEWHGHMCDDGPGPQPIEVQLDRVWFCARFLQGIDGPHGKVRHQQEGHQFTPWLAADLVWRHTRASWCVQHEHRLTRSLQERCQCRDEHQHCVLLDREVTTDDREGAVDE